MVNFNKIKISLILGLVFSSFLFSENCYVLVNVSEDGANGSENNPYNDIEQCINSTNNSSYTTINVGPGEYGIDELFLGERTLIGSGVNSTVLYAKTYLPGYLIKMDNYSEISHFTISNHPSEGWYASDVILLGGNETGQMKIHNIHFKSNVSDKTIETQFNIWDMNSNADLRNRDIKICNNLFGPAPNNVRFLTYKNKSFLNNMIYGSRLNFEVYEGLSSDAIHEAYFHNNLHVSTDACGWPTSGVDNFTYNIMLYVDNDFLLGEYYYGSTNDSDCGEQGDYQTSMYLTSLDELNFINENWYLYHIYYTGENSGLFDSGHPDHQFNDIDGSRADVGLMGGLYPWTSVGAIITDFSVSPTTVPLDGTIQINARAVTE